MKRIVRTIAALTLCLALAMPVAAADRHGNGNRGHRTEHNGNRHDRGHDNRHNDRHDNHNNKHHDKHHDNRRPGHNTPPPPPPTPRPRPHAYHYAPPAWHRPAPPRHYRYVSGGPTFGSILGIALGTAFDAGLNALINAGYNVAGYGNNMVNLTDVYNVNYVWPNATLYYDNGYFAGGTFVDYAAYRNPARYNGVYSYLTGRYGAPVSVVNNGVTISGTWFGEGGRFVTLSYGPSGSGYVTTLSYGR